VRWQTLQTSTRFHTAFHKLSLLFHNIIQAFALSEPRILRERLLLLKALEGGSIGSTLVQGDHARERRMARVQHLPEQLFGVVGITDGAEHEVQRGPRRVDGPLEGGPLLLDLDLRLIDAV
jgi:hypothetical protein